MPFLGILVSFVYFQMGILNAFHEPIYIQAVLIKVFF